PANCGPTRMYSPSMYPCSGRSVGWLHAAKNTIKTASAQRRSGTVVAIFFPRGSPVAYRMPAMAQRAHDRPTRRAREQPSVESANQYLIEQPYGVDAAVVTAVPAVACVSAART